jgi:hypothetical protein
MSTRRTGFDRPSDCSRGLTSAPDVVYSFEVAEPVILGMLLASSPINLQEMC